MNLLDVFLIFKNETKSFTRADANGCDLRSIPSPTGGGTVGCC